jgi:hypothetical protein
MRTALLFVAAMLTCSKTLGQEDMFEVAIDRDLVAKLPSDTRVSFWHSRNKDGWRVHTIDDFPLMIDRRELADHGWNVTFSANKSTLFGIMLPKSLLATTNTYRIALKEPTMNVHFVPLTREIRCICTIGDGVQYLDYPRLDPLTKMLRDSLPPKIKIVSKRTGDILSDADMVTGCMGLKWTYNVRTLENTSIEPAMATVKIDTGGLFELTSGVLDAIPVQETIN